MHAFEDRPRTRAALTDRPSRAAAMTVDELEAAARAALDAGDHRRVVTLLMQGYGQAIYRHCLAFLRDRAMADDVHQTVFVQAYRDLARFDGRSKLRSWLYSIARHRCLDAVKIGRRRRARFALTETPIEGVDSRASAEAQLIAHDLEGPLAEALAQLKPKVRSAVLMRFQDNLSYAEMARITGERAGTLQARVVRAMPKLRRHLEERGVVA